MRELTIDTWVLYRANEGDLSAWRLLFLVLDHKVVFDHEGCIAAEYGHCLGRTNNSLLGKWLETLKRERKMVFYSGKLPRRHEQALLRLKFDRSDLPFVAVAFKKQRQAAGQRR